MTDFSNLMGSVKVTKKLLVILLITPLGNLRIYSI